MSGVRVPSATPTICKQLINKGSDVCASGPFFFAFTQIFDLTGIVGWSPLRWHEVPRYEPKALPSDRTSAAYVEQEAIHEQGASLLSRAAASAEQLVASQHHADLRPYLWR